MKVILHGPPVGKPTMTHSDKWNTRECVLEYRAFCDRLRFKAYGKNRKQPLAGPTILTVACFIADTNKQFKRSGPHTIKPDASNILKAIEDALFLNDQVIYSAACEKRWANGSPERIEIEWFTESESEAA